MLYSRQEESAPSVTAVGSVQSKPHTQRSHIDAVCTGGCSVGFRQGIEEVRDEGTWVWVGGA